MAAVEALAKIINEVPQGPGRAYILTHALAAICEGVGIEAVVMIEAKISDEVAKAMNEARKDVH